MPGAGRNVSKPAKMRGQHAPPHRPPPLGPTLRASTSSPACISAWIGPSRTPRPIRLRSADHRRAVHPSRSPRPQARQGRGTRPTDREGQTVIRMRGLRPVNAAWKVPTILTDASPQIELVRHLWLDMKLAGDIAVDRRATFPRNGGKLPQRIERIPNTIPHIPPAAPPEQRQNAPDGDVCRRSHLLC
jgi:hypothetical protein